MSPTLLEIARAMAEPLTFRAKVRAMIDEEVRLAVAAEREYWVTRLEKARPSDADMDGNRYWLGWDDCLSATIRAIRARGEAVR